ncbi:hypothetical protein CI109_101945 [Kwoniella shandongensis]|uniref:Uncharacterized protein n=1 Tax=Kwoniella shandongensis TaxID=1734106 RepID=A0A5M6BVJ5_9TREE|nr:uncharacterized protein CI109_005395 [Kwoniella shandongensis]KAA5526271.1 hypothetical protein CI109_005395 [Kwoniella shandongensis]
MSDTYDDYPSSGGNDEGVSRVNESSTMVHWLGPLPSQSDSSRDAETESALKTLFGEAATTTDQHPEQDSGPEPTLASASESANQVKELDSLAAAAVATTMEDERDGSLPIDPTLIDRSVTPTSSAAGNNHIGTDTGGGASAAVKRKASSRANMLARGGACEFCKRRKLKCSAEEPTCANCAKIGRECVYSQKKQRSRVKVLEDRLQELEKRLDHQNTSSNHPSVATIASGSDEVLRTPGQDGVEVGGTGPGVYDDTFTLSSFELGLTPDKRFEPDLMTLADAAAADTSVKAIGDGMTFPWEDLSPEAIANEIVKAAAGGKGIGEKIVAHLIQLYVGPPSCAFLHPIIPPSTLVARLSPNSTSPIHACLLLSFIPFLLPLSPSPALQSPSIPSLLLPHSRAQSVHAITVADPRFLDLLTANMIRGMTFYDQARFLEGWAETPASAGMIHATGLDKMGYVGERFLAEKSDGWKERSAREKKMRLVIQKGVIIPPPETVKEFEDRMNLFWFVYKCDRAAAIGWGWPSSFQDEEISTPWPKEEYESHAALSDNRTIYHFMNSTTVDSAANDSTLCAQVKGITLLFHATRLCDLPSGIATPERTSRLIRLTQEYMSDLRPVKREYSDLPSTIGSLNQAWMTLYCALVFLFAKEEVDAIPGTEREYLDKVIDVAGKVVDHIQLAQASSGVEFAGHDLASAVIWQALGRLMYKYSNRLASDSEPKEGDEARIAVLQSHGHAFRSALAVMGKTVRFAAVGTHLLDNIMLGSEFKTGEWERPDNVE